MGVEEELTGLTPRQLARNRSMQSKTARTNARGATSMVEEGEPRPRRQLFTSNLSVKTSPTKLNSSISRVDGGPPGHSLQLEAPFVVVMVRAIEVEDEPFSVGDEDEKEQPAPAGKFEQPNLICWLKP